MPKILVADDDLVVLATISLGLRRAGYEVLQADGGEAAILICRQDEPDLAILDVRMPGMSGIEVAQVLKRTTRIPFIFLSAFSDEDIVQAAAESGALGYLVKPVEITRMLPAIEVALARAEDLTALERGNADLAAALGRNREIDVAVGIVMGSHGLTRAAAFEALRSYARGRRLKIAEVAQRLIGGEKFSLTPPREPTSPY